MRLAPAALVVALAAAIALPSPGGLGLRPRDADGARAVERVMDELSTGSLVAVAFDPDAGTYAEIRPAVRTLLADLIARDVTLAVVTLTPEGRALWIAEAARLTADGADGGAIVDLGFVAGAEAAIVALTRDGSGIVDDGGEPDERVEGNGLSEADALVVVGGNDIGPRTWVEQFLPRVEAMPIVAVAPTFLLPELLPYEATGQIDALVVTPGDVAAVREVLNDDGAAATDRPVDRLAVLVGMLVALAVLVHAVGSRLAPSLRRRGREVA